MSGPNEDLREYILGIEAENERLREALDRAHETGDADMRARDEAKTENERLREALAEARPWLEGCRGRALTTERRAELDALIERVPDA